MLKPGVFITEDGSHSIFSEQFGFSYHSRFGAVQETQHVFIDAALRFKAAVQQEIAILDIGFGTGLNAYMTFLESRRRNLSIDYTAVEAFPITMEQAQALNYSEMLQAEEDQATFLESHQAPWNASIQLSDFFALHKRQQKFQALSFEQSFDIIYFDAFAPTAQPELWNDAMMAAMFRALKPNGILTTYCAKGSVKRSMKKAGFMVEGLKGPPGKREMTRATRG